MAGVEEFYKKTIELVNVAEDKTITDRDAKIAKIEQILEEREKLLGALVAPFSPEEHNLRDELIALNEKFEQLVEAEKLIIQKDLRELQHKKETSTKYVNPYESLANRDGVYYDKRN